MTHSSHYPSQRSRSAACLMIAIGALAGPASGGGYTFVKIADTTGPFSDFEFGPSVNDSGVVVFQAHLDGGGQGIFTGNGGATTTITDTPSGPYASLFGVPVINDAGTVAFWGILDGSGRRISTGTGGPLTIVADTPTGPYTDLGNLPSVNTGGTVAFRFNTFTPSAGVGLATGSGILYAYYFGATPPHGFGSFSDPDINDSGIVAWAGSYAPPVSGQGVFRGNGSTHTTIADTAGQFNGFFPFISINNSGTCVFTATLDTGHVGVFKASGGAVTTIADSSGPYGTFNVSHPAINNNGLVAFKAGPDSGGLGIFTGPDPVADKVIKTGDLLFGSTLSDVIFDSGLNDRGDVAFKYSLATGVEGIALAVAKTPPPPADLSGDSHVNGIDLAILLGQWTGPLAYAPCPPFKPADFNHDCKVNGLDLAVLLAAWG